MAIDIFNEEVLTLKAAAKRLPKTARNKTLSLSTLHRWIHGGLKAVDCEIVRLEAFKYGGHWCTTVEALQRFFERLSQAPEEQRFKPILSAKRLRQIRAAEKELERLGL